MEFWTVMWITVLSGPIEGSTSGLVYPSLAQCEQSIAQVVGTIEGAYDYNVVCEETATMSSSLRPKRRPEGALQ